MIRGNIINTKSTLPPIKQKSGILVSELDAQWLSYDTFPKWQVIASVRLQQRPWLKISFNFEASSNYKKIYHVPNADIATIPQNMTVLL